MRRSFAVHRRNIFSKASKFYKIKVPLSYKILWAKKHTRGHEIMLTLQPIGSQIPLIQIVESDDRALLSSPEADGTGYFFIFHGLIIGEQPLNITMPFINST